jgi:hypothetical protein
MCDIININEKNKMKKYFLREHINSIIHVNNIICNYV